MDLTLDSSDDDDVYVNSVARLKALNKKTKTVVDEEEEDEDDDIPNGPNPYAAAVGIDDSEDESEEDLGLPNRIIPQKIVATANTVPEVTENTGVQPLPNPQTKPAQVSTRNEIDDLLNYSIDTELDRSDSFILIGSPPKSKENEVDNYHETIKVLWRSDHYEHFELRKHETFQKIFQHFAKLEGVPEDQILITRKNIPISPFETPASIGWRIIDILDGGVVSAEMAGAQKHQTKAATTEEDEGCKIRLQLSEKQSVVVSVKRDESFACLLEECSKQLNVPEENIKLYFDGEIVDVTETPESLDLDEEACFDIKVK